MNIHTLTVAHKRGVFELNAKHGGFAQLLKCIVPVDVHHEDMGSLKASTEEKVMFQFSLAWAKISTRPAACWS